MDTPQDALAALDELARIRRRALDPYRTFWYPLVLFGAITLASAPLYVVAPSVTSAYWVVAPIAAWVATGRYYARRGRNAGVGAPRTVRRTNLYWLGVWFAVFVVGSVAASLHDTAAIVAGTGGVLGAAYLWIAWRARDAVLGAMAAGIVAAGAAVAAARPADSYTIFMLATGSLLALTGFYLHATREVA